MGKDEGHLRLIKLEKSGTLVNKLASINFGDWISGISRLFTLCSVKVVCILKFVRCKVAAT